MKTKRLMILLLMAGTFLMMTSNIGACTIFTAVQGDTVLFGGNEDQLPNDSFMVVDRSGTYGVVYFATPWDIWPLVMQMGINEKGLCYDTNYIPKERLNPHPERKRQLVWVVQTLMRESASVEEVVSKMYQYNWGTHMSYQVHMADKHGDAIVIHPGSDGEITYTRIDPQKHFLVSTNINAGSYSKGDGYCRRNERVQKILSTMATGTELSLALMTSALKATHANRRYKTLYSAVYDLKKQRIYLFYQRRFDAPVVLDVDKALYRVQYPKKYRIVPLEQVVASTQP